MSDFAPTPDQLEQARKLFARECLFTIGAQKSEHIPATDIPEVAFVGRSNVGKSSLLNALTNRKSLARTSSTPGRTRQLNFFVLDNQLMLVDLPGYGYAKASKRDIEGWTNLMFDYLIGRSQLSRVFLLIDSRHGIKPNDEEAMRVLNEVAVPYQVVLTKCDKTGAVELEKIKARAMEIIAKNVAALPRLACTSSEKKIGIDLLQAEIISLAGLTA